MWERFLKAVRPSGGAVQPSPVYRHSGKKKSSTYFSTLNSSHLAERDGEQRCLKRCAGLLDGWVFSRCHNALKQEEVMKAEQEKHAGFPLFHSEELRERQEAGRQRQEVSQEDGGWRLARRIEAGG